MHYSAKRGHEITCRLSVCLSELIINQNVSLSLCRHCKVLDENAEQCEKPRQRQPLPLEACGLHITHECLGPPHSPRQMTARLLYVVPHNDATKSPLVTMGRRKFTVQTAPSPSTITPKSNTPIPSPTPLTTPNGIQIQSANTDVQTDMGGRHGPSHKRSAQLF